MVMRMIVNEAMVQAFVVCLIPYSERHDQQNCPVQEN